MFCQNEGIYVSFNLKKKVMKNMHYLTGKLIFNLSDITKYST